MAKKPPTKKPAAKKAPNYTPEERAAQHYMHSGSYYKDESGQLHKVKGAYAAQLVGKAFTKAAGYTQEYADFSKANPGMVAPVDLGFGSYDPSTMGFTFAGGTKTRGQKGHRKALARGAGLGKAAGGISPETPAMPFGGPGAEAFTPYAEADVATTNYTRAQGKAYGRGRGSGLLGQTASPPETAATEESAVVGGGKKHPGRKATSKAKRKSSPGGRKATPKERRAIRRAKVK